MATRLVRDGFSERAEFVKAVAPRHMKAKMVPATGSRRTYKPPHSNAARVPRLRSRWDIVKALGKGISVPLLAACRKGVAGVNKVQGQRAQNRGQVNSAGG